MDLTAWVRPNILRLKPYSSARDEFQGEALVFLDANENPFNTPYNRYPDPRQRRLKSKVAELKQIEEEKIFLGNGSDEAIDLLIRAFCEPGIHNMIQTEPTYGMYQVAAGVNNVAVIKVPLTKDYQLDTEALLASVTPQTRMIFLCSPNNPTGNALNYNDIESVIRNFEGPVVVDEAYIDFAPHFSFLTRLAEFNNLILLQTFSKAWGMAGIRLGMAFAQPGIIEILNKIKYPYNLSILTQQKAMELLSRSGMKQKWVEILLQERDKLFTGLQQISFVEKVWPSDANFMLVKMRDARKIYEFLVERGIIVRDRSRILLCENSLRITVGTPGENKTLLDCLNKYQQHRE